LFARETRFTDALADMLRPPENEEKPQYKCQRVVLKYLYDAKDRIDGYGDLITELSESMRKIIDSVDVNGRDEDAHIALLLSIRLLTAAHVLPEELLLGKLADARDNWTRFVIAQSHVEHLSNLHPSLPKPVLEVFLQPLKRGMKEDYISPRHYVASLIALAASGAVPRRDANGMMRTLTGLRRADVVAALRDCLQESEYHVFTEVRRLLLWKRARYRVRKRERT
jgi:hypothetical protein